MRLKKMKTGSTTSSHRNNLSAFGDAFAKDDITFFDQSHFNYLLRIERRRTERSEKPFLLVLLDISRLMKTRRDIKIVDEIKNSLNPLLREIDIRGWYQDKSIIGVIFTEIARLDKKFIDTVIHKIYERFDEKLDHTLLDNIYISYHVFPETNQDLSENVPFNINLYPDIEKKRLNKKFSLFVKEVFFDRVGSAVALLLFSPLFLIIAIAIKATSPGPVFFRQERVGFNGKTFLFYKFRSMRMDNDPRVHQEYIARFINQPNTATVEPGVFKLTNDHRITPVGRFIRKTSLDELPQFINVLKGDMSMVGPRPPIPYECDLYHIWHRRRLLSAKPGITGLWQVIGRSRTTFDEMVRLDLKYLQEWSLLLDVKILLMTPKAVFSGTGAY